MKDYGDGYLNITVKSGEIFDIDGVEVHNKTDDDFHMLCKLIKQQVIKIKLDKDV